MLPGARRTPIAFAAPILAAAALAGCGSTGPAATDPSGRIEVVAAESFWGSLASQLGGRRVHVTSVIANPGADPHEYEPTAADARTLAGARLAIVNGAGYDPWATKLLDASPADARTVLNVGDLAGVQPGGNPHLWYSPAVVRRVIARIAADLGRLDPGHASYYRARRRKLESRGLARYRRLIAQIRRDYAGTPVGASESIFAPLARALGLALLTPPALLRAVGEGTDPTPAAKIAADRQIAAKEIAVWVYDSQNATPDVRRLTDAARARGIPVATIAETPDPASLSFQSWQARQLRSLRAALARAHHP